MQAMPWPGLWTGQHRTAWAVCADHRVCFIRQLSEFHLYGVLDRYGIADGWCCNRSGSGFGGPVRTHGVGAHRADHSICGAWHLICHAFSVAVCDRPGEFSPARDGERVSADRLRRLFSDNASVRRCNYTAAPPRRRNREKGQQKSDERSRYYLGSVVCYLFAQRAGAGCLVLRHPVFQVVRRCSHHQRRCIFPAD